MDSLDNNIWISLDVSILLVIFHISQDGIGIHFNLMYILRMGTPYKNDTAK